MWRRVRIWKRKLKSGAVYGLRWHDDNGRVRTESVGSSRKLAEELQHKRERELNNGELRATARIKYKEFESEEVEIMRPRLPVRKGRRDQRTVDVEYAGRAGLGSYVRDAVSCFHTRP